MIKLKDILFEESKIKEATKNTAFIESIAAMGIYFNTSDAKAVKSFLDFLITDTPSTAKLKKASSEILEAYNRLSEKFIGIIKKIASDRKSIEELDVTEISNRLFGTQDYMKIFDDIFWSVKLSYGMYSFYTQNVQSVITKPYAIRKNISTYRTLENDQFKGEDLGAKPNTSDILITSAPYSKIEGVYKSGERFKIKGKYIMIGDISIFQISLKKTETGAQLGKIGQYLVNRKMAYTAGEVATGLTIKEGVISDLFAFGKELTNKFIMPFINKIKSYLNKWFGLFDDSIEGEYVNTQKEIFNTNSHQETIEEIEDLCDFDETTITEGAMTPATQEKLKRLQQRLNILYKTLDSELSDTLLLINKNEIKFLIEYYLNKKINKTSLDKFKRLDKSLRIKVLFNLTANIATLKTVKKMVSNKVEFEKLVFDLISEMLFGSTKFPTWKVYAYNKDESNWIYLGTRNSFKQNLTSKTKKSSDLNLELMGMSIYPVKGENYYYIITLYLFTDIDKNMGVKIYTPIRTSPNSSSHFTNVFEGQPIKLKIEFSKSIKEALIKDSGE